MIYRFGAFTLDTGREVLSGPNGPVTLRRQTFRLLRTLLEHAPELVRHDVLIDQVWGRTALSPNVLPQAISALRHALEDDPQTPKYIQTAHRRGYRLVCDVECLGHEDPVPTATVAPVLRWRNPMAIAVAVLLIASAGTWWLLTDPASEPPAIVSQERQRVAVALGVFPHADGVPAWVPPAAVELLALKLSADERLLVLRSDSLGLPSGQTNARWQHLMRDLLGAPHALVGHWRTDDDKNLRLDLNLINLDSGRLLYGEQFSASADELDTLLINAVDTLRKSLDLPAIANDSRWHTMESRFRQPYWEALAALNQGQGEKAAAQLDTLYSGLGHPVWMAPQLARALRLAGRRDEAIAVLEDIADAPEIRRGLGDSLRIRAELARLRFDTAQTAATLRALSALFPDEADLLLDLATAELDNLNGNAAREIVSRLSANPALSLDPRLQLLQARLTRLDGDLERSATLAERVVHSATEYDLPVIAARATISLAETYTAGGDLLGAEETLNSAVQRWGDVLPQNEYFELKLMYATTLRARGDMSTAIDVLATLKDMDVPRQYIMRAQVEESMLNWEQDNFTAAEMILDEIEERMSGINDPDLIIAVERSLGLIDTERNRPNEARRRFENATTVARRTGRAHNVAIMQVNAGLSMARQRRYDEADGLWESSLPIFEQIGDKRGIALCLSNLAATAAIRGRHERSHELNERALTLFRELNMNSQVARTSFNLGLLASRQGQFALAQTMFSEAQNAYADAGNLNHALAAGARRITLLTDANRLDDAAEVLASMNVWLDGAQVSRQADLYSAEGWLKIWSGDTESARQAYETAQQLRIESEQQSWIAMSTIELLQLELLTGADPARIRVHAETLLQTFTDLNEPRGRSRALALIAETLITQNRHEEARLYLRQAHAAQLEMPDVSVQILLSWLDAWASEPEERSLRLEALAERCQELGLISRWFQVQLVLDPDTHAESLSDGTMTGLLPPYVHAALAID